MITVKSLTLRNFLSIGQVTQAIDFNKTDLTLILGENLDLGGDGARNGTGKTTIIQGLSYALFGSAINQIKKDNLINRTNGKGMVATVEFSARGVDYRIVRGRKPNILKFYVNNIEQDSSDDAQGDSRETQDAIERVLCMSNDMFRQIIALNTYNEPFLAMKVSDQRNIIEQLLGITLLTEKAEAIKELNRKTKEEIQREEFNIKGIETANQKISEQIEALQKRQRLWQAKHDEDLGRLVDEYDQLSQIKIERELAAHKELIQFNARFEKLGRYNALLARQTAWSQKRDTAYAKLQAELDELNRVDIAAELVAHETVALHDARTKEAAQHAKSLKRAHDDAATWSKQAQKLTQEIHELEQHRCYACGQEFHDSKHTEVLDNKRKLLAEAEAKYAQLYSEWSQLEQNPVVVPDRPATHYPTQAGALQHSNAIASVLERMKGNRSEADPYAEQLAENWVEHLGERPVTHYDTEEQAFKHSNRVETLLQQITTKHGEVDPYAEQISEMQRTGLIQISYDALNNLTKLLQHQDYLLDLLTNKKSFVRKRIIDQNLGYLNARLTHYLDKMGLPHQVVFQNDLSVEITELGRELDFDNLSRGERNRLILGLSFAFRDVWENLYSPINVLFVDELIDNGLDTIGVENSIALLKDMVRRRNKSIWLVSHRDELTNRVGSVLKVVKEGGFTSYSTVTDTE